MASTNIYHMNSGQYSSNNDFSKSISNKINADIGYNPLEINDPDSNIRSHQIRKIGGWVSTFVENDIT